MTTKHIHIYVGGKVKDPSYSSKLGKAKNAILTALSTTDDISPSDDLSDEDISRIAKAVRLLRQAQSELREVH